MNTQPESDSPPHCSANYTVDILRGPSVIGSPRVVDGQLMYTAKKFQWSKLRRVIEQGLQAAQLGNCVQLTILIQPTNAQNEKA